MHRLGITGFQDTSEEDDSFEADYDIAPGDPRQIERYLRHILGKELIAPNSDLKVGNEIAEWDEAPSSSEMDEKIGGKSYEERSGKLLTDDLQVARYFIVYNLNSALVHSNYSKET